MSDDDTAPEKPAKDQEPVRRPRPRPSVDDVFGDVLPETTGDERDASRRRSSPTRDDRDDEFLRDVPPHHG